MTRLVHMMMLFSIAFLPLAIRRPTIAWQSRVDPSVIEQAAAGPVEFIVFLKEQAELSGIDSSWTKAEKGEYVYQKLTEVALDTQQPILSALQDLEKTSQTPMEHREFWVANAIWVRADPKILQTLAERRDVAHIFANPHVRLDVQETPASPIGPASPQAIEANIIKTRAPLAWGQGYTGQGAIIGGQDTGYDWDHPALIGKYRGWDGSSADHSYSWHDAIHTNDGHTAAGNPCGFNSPVPCDDGSHGTHTMGTMVGDDGLGNQIGMAPGARWIGCRNMEQGWGTPATYMECYQWFIAPTDSSNLNPRPDLAPDVINNSWACTYGEGCVDPLVLKTTVENVRAAGILTVHSAGNKGSSCNTVDEPATIYDASFSVGATDLNDNILGFSSRGPVSVDGSFRPKPDVSAPGYYLRSSVPSDPGENLYGSKQGTSMAAPHVAGLAALLISAKPELAGQVDLIEEIITHSAVPRTTAQTCGGVPGSQIPNNTYGWGRIDAANAVDLLLKEMRISKIASDESYDPGQLITYTLKVDTSYLYNLTSNLVVTDVIPADTTFITATLPHTKIGDTVVWEIAQIDPGETVQLELVVQVSGSAADPIFNQDYSASAIDFGRVFGGPVMIDRAIYYYYPWISQH